MRRSFHSHRDLNSALGPLALLAAGLVVLGVGQLAGAAQRRLPLYDGVVVEDPYRYVAPASGQAGNPQTGEVVNQVSGSTSPSLVVTTGENPPQAQLIAPSGAFDVSGGVTSLTGTLTPLAPTAAQTQAGALGNIYGISVTDQNGTPVPMSSGVTATMILRSPYQDLQVADALWNGTMFTLLPSITGNQVDLIKAQVSVLGDFAIVPGPSSGSGPGTLFLAGAVLLVVALVGTLYLRRRRAAPAPAPAASVRRANQPPPRPNKSRKRGRQ